MHLFTVTCRRSLPGGQWDKRDALVIADTAAEAEEQCRQQCAAEGHSPPYTTVKVIQQVNAPQASQQGPARFERWLGDQEA